MHSPALNPLPWSVWLLTLAIAGVELVLWAGAHGLVNMAGSAGLRAQALVLAGVNPGLQGWMIETGQTSLPHLARYFGFGLVHQGPLQAGLVVIITAALGKTCAERIGSLRLLAVLALSQAAGGVVFGLTAAPEAWLIGGYPLIFALAGCYAGLVWHGDSAPVGRRKALGLVAVLIAGRLLLAVLVGGGMDWIADLTACVAGYALGRILRPGLRLRLRRA